MKYDGRLFLHVSVCSQVPGPLVPGPFWGVPPGLWFQVLSRGTASPVTGPVQSPAPGGTPAMTRGTPWLGQGIPIWPGHKGTPQPGQGEEVLPNQDSVITSS